MSIQVSAIDVKAIDERGACIILVQIEQESFYWCIEMLAQ
jgi:hypothetical protein